MKPDLNWYYEQIKDAALEVVEKGEKIQWYRLSKYPDRSSMSTDLIFTPFAVIITGDNRVCQQGCQALGYSLDWFAQRLDAHYLAEKFLERCWVPDLAKEYWRDMQAEYRKSMEEITPDFEEGEDYDDELLQKRSWKVGGETLEGVTVIDAIDALLNLDCWSSGDMLYQHLPGVKMVYDKWSVSKTERWICPFDASDGLGGYGYKPAEVGWLAAVQKRFAETYNEQIAEGAKNEDHPF